MSLLSGALLTLLVGCWSRDNPSDRWCCADPSRPDQHCIAGQCISLDAGLDLSIADLRSPSDGPRDVGATDISLVPFAGKLEQRSGLGCEPNEIAVAATIDCNPSRLRETLPSLTNSWQVQCTGNKNFLSTLCLTTSRSVANNIRRAATISCPADQRAIAGGCSCDTALATSEPLDKLTGWRCACQDNAPVALVAVICSSLAVHVLSETLPVDSSSSGPTFVTTPICPSNTVHIGGGCATDNPSAATLIGIFLGADATRCTYAFTAEPLTITATALCAKR